MERGEVIVAAARAAVGTPVRLQGRKAGLGLDCVGLCALALAAAGARFAIPADYSLTADNRARLARGLSASGLIRVPSAEPGDVLQIDVAPGHHHLAIASEAGIIHADFGLRRVVEARLPPEWRILSIWRWRGEG